MTDERARRFEERCEAYLEGLLDPEETRRFERALVEDEELAQRFREVLVLRELLHEVGPEPPAELADALVERVLAELPARGREKADRPVRLPRLRAALEGSSWALRGPALAITAQPDAPSGAPAVLNGLTAARFALPSREEEPAPRRPWWRRLLGRRGKRG